jgi:hypothetical protein
MSTNTLFFLETGLFEGAALVWAVWQIWSIRPKKKAKPGEPSALARSSSENSRHAEGQHRPHDRGSQPGEG